MLRARSRWLSAVIAAAATIVVGIQSASVGLTVPLGPDGGLWGVAARVRAAGQPVALPPLFPTLAGWFGFGDPMVGALVVNAFAVGFTAWLVGEVAAAAARTEDVRAAARLGGTLLGTVCLHGGLVASQVQPEAVSLMVLTLLIWAGQRALAEPTVKRFALWGGAIGLVFTAREHGLVVGAFTLAVAASVPGEGRLRRILGLLAVAQLVGMIVGGEISGIAGVVADGIGRSSAHLGESARLSAGLGIEGGPPDMDGAARSAARGLGLAWVMLRRGGEVGLPESLALVGATWAVVRIARSRRVALAMAFGAPLASLAATMVLWTQWRHVLVVAGPALAVFLVGVVEAVEARGGVRRFGGIVVVVVLLSAPQAWLAVRTGRGAPVVPANATELRAAAAFIAAHAAPGDLAAGDLRGVLLTGLLPSPIPPGTPPGSLRTPSVGWRTWILSRTTAPSALWREQATFGPFRVLRAEAPAAKRACLAGTLNSAGIADFPVMNPEESSWVSPADPALCADR